MMAFYQPIAKQREVTVRVVAMGDYMRKPTIKPLDLSNYKARIGDMIKIRAIDDIGFAHLNVEIVAQDGTHSEEGERSDKWI